MPLTHAHLSSFITNYLRGENLGPDDFVTGSTLIRLCQHAFCDEDEASQLEYEEDRKAIVKCIRRMKVEGVLKMFCLGEARGRGFALAENEGLGGSGQEEVVQSPFVQLSDVVEGDESRRGSEDAPEPATADTSVQEEEEEEEEEPSGRRVWSEESDVELTSSQQEAVERAEEIRAHTEAYSAMTRDAIPLIPPPTERPTVQTPSRKRQRTLEIAASDSRNSFDPISLQRYANSTPRRSAKKVCPGTPLSELRRRSAPSRLNSPRKGELQRSLWSPKKVALGPLEQSSRGEEGRQILFKEERKDTTAPWILKVIDNLHSKYPESTFEPSNGFIKCLDCGGREFKMSGNNTFNGFEAHLRGKAHKAEVAKRMENPKCQFPYQDSLLSSKTMDLGIDFNIPQQPIAVFANQAMPVSNVASLGSQFFAAMQNDHHAKEMRTTFLEARQKSADQKIAQNTEQLKELSGSIEASVETVKEVAKELAEKVEASEDKLGSLLKEVTEHFDSTEAKTGDQLKAIRDRLTEATNDYDVRLEKMFGSLAKSNHRNMDNIDDLKESNRKLTEEFHAYRTEIGAWTVQLDEVDQMSKQLRSEVEFKMTEVEETLMESKRHRAQLDARMRELEASTTKVSEEISHQLESKMLGSNEYLAQLESKIQKLEDTVRNSNVERAQLMSEVSELEKSFQDTSDQRARIESRMRDLEETDKRREDDFHDLEAQSQLHTEELDRQRESNTIFKKTITDQIEKHIQHSEKRRKATEEAADERERSALERERLLEEKFEKRFAVLEKALEAEKERSRKKGKAMERRIRELEDEVDAVKGAVPLIFEDSQELREYVGTVEAKVAELRDSVGGGRESRGVSESRRSVPV